MTKTILCSLLLIASSFISAFGQISIQLPDEPVIEAIPAAWRGHNQGAASNISNIQTPEYFEAVSALDPGIFRWPGGNSANNYKWQNHINDLNQLHIVNMVDYLNTFDAKMQVVVNFGNGTAREAAEFVRFCNSTAPSYSTWRNTVLGNTSTINVKYWEVGNENTNGWSFGWSWLGHTDSVFLQTGVPVHYLEKHVQDSLYYYGGRFWREGFVPAIGGLNNQTAILGTSKYYLQNSISDTLKVEYPKLDTLDNNAVRIYFTRNMDFSWAQSVMSQQELYDSIANPANLLSASEYEWNETHVAISPTGGIDSSDAVLIEYNSTRHDGAFAFRDSMKMADPTIEIGYNVKLVDELSLNPVFQQDFAASPPDFMIKHPYAGNVTLPAMTSGYFSEVAYLSENKVQAFSNFQQLWNERVINWGIPNNIGLSLTEWNIALFDDAPADHEVRGISCGLYVADFWAHTFQFALADSFDLRTNNHFALSATGNNFIHLFHPNNPFTTSVEGDATTMVMETVGAGMFPIVLNNNPLIEVFSATGGNLDTLDVPAVVAWGGVSDDPNYINLLLINRNDELAHDVDLQIPNSWMIDSVFTRTMYGSMVDSAMFYSNIEMELNGSSVSVNLPAFSVTTVKMKIDSNLVSIKGNQQETVAIVYPNPVTDRISIRSVMDPENVLIYNAFGEFVLGKETVSHQGINVSQLRSGMYFLKFNIDGDQHRVRFIKL